MTMQPERRNNRQPHAVCLERRHGYHEPRHQQDRERDGCVCCVGDLHKPIVPRGVC